MRISDWSSDVCSSDLAGRDAVADQPALVLEAEHERLGARGHDHGPGPVGGLGGVRVADPDAEGAGGEVDAGDLLGADVSAEAQRLLAKGHHQLGAHDALGEAGEGLDFGGELRSEEHTSEPQY